MTRTATLTFDGRTIELPVIEGTEGELAIDITELRDRTGLITLDPGFGNTGACNSAITFIDGEKGILRYRGIPIEQLAKHSNFIEVAWLLIFGRLPNRAELDRFSERLTDNALLHEAFKHQFEGFPVDAPPMAMLSAMINTLACFPPEQRAVAADRGGDVRRGGRAADQQGPHDRRLLLPPLAGAAVHLSRPEAAATAPTSCT